MARSSSVARLSYDMRINALPTITICGESKWLSLTLCPPAGTPWNGVGSRKKCHALVQAISHRVVLFAFFAWPPRNSAAGHAGGHVHQLSHKPLITYPPPPSLSQPSKHKKCPPQTPASTSRCNLPAHTFMHHAFPLYPFSYS